MSSQNGEPEKTARKDNKETWSERTAGRTDKNRNPESMIEGKECFHFGLDLLADLAFGAGPLLTPAAFLHRCWFGLSN